MVSTRASADLDKDASKAERDGHASDQVADFEERRRKVIGKVQDFVQITFHELHAASRQDTQNLLEGTKYITEKDIDGWESYVNGLMQDQIASARKLYEQLMDPLLEALRDKAISERVVSKLYAEFRSEEIGYKQKEWYVQTILPERLREWKRIKKERDDLIKNPQVVTLKNAKIPHFEALLDSEKFADLEWKERKKLVEEVQAHLAARKNGTEKLMPSIRSELTAYQREGILHSSKISTWMKRIFVTNATPEDIEEFMKNTVRPFAESWRTVRTDFDNLHKTMGKKVPRGFKRLTVDAFLLKDYKQRTSYCDLLRLRLEDVVEQDKQLASLKLRIRHNLDTEDWEGAETDLMTALREWPDNRELLSMKTYLECHRRAADEDGEDASEKKEKETPDPEGLLRNLRGMFSSIEGELHLMYVEAALAGPKVFNRFLQLSYNRVWVHENGYSDPSREIRNARDEFNQEMTKQYMEQGHSDEIEHNVIDGETAAQEAIRADSRKPQMLYVGTMGRHAVMATVKDNADNEDFGYGTSLVPTNTAYEVHARIVKNWHHPMKTALRQLDAMGYRFTVAGSLQRKGTERAHERN